MIAAAAGGGGGSCCCCCCAMVFAAIEQTTKLDRVQYHYAKFEADWKEIKLIRSRLDLTSSMMTTLSVDYF